MIIQRWDVVIARQIFIWTILSWKHVSSVVSGQSTNGKTNLSFLPDHDAVGFGVILDHFGCHLITLKLSKWLVITPLQNISEQQHQLSIIIHTSVPTLHWIKNIIFQNKVLHAFLNLIVSLKSERSKCRYEIFKSVSVVHFTDGYQWEISDIRHQFSVAEMLEWRRVSVRCERCQIILFCHDDDKMGAVVSPDPALDPGVGQQQLWSSAIQVTIHDHEFLNIVIDYSH